MTELRVEAGRRIREELENGRDHDALHGARVTPSARPGQPPAAPTW